MTRLLIPIFLITAGLPVAGQTRRTDRHVDRTHARASTVDRGYESASRALDAGRWEDAHNKFAEIAERKGDRADGALYWKAYSENRLGKRDEALATLATLRQAYGKSAWLNDAQALEQEIKQQAGRPVNPEAESNEDLKLMAINGLLHSDPDQAMPLLEKLLKSANSPRLKERALFVLSQGRTPRARQLLSGIARGGSNPDLQLKAVRYIGMSGSKEARDDLASIYTSSSDVTLKRAILKSFLTSGSREPLLNAAKSEKDPDLRIEAIRILGMMGGQSELVDMAKSEKDPNVRMVVIRSLGMTGKTTDVLATMYSAETDAGIRKEIVKSMFMQQNAKGLIDLARKETNPEMKKDLVQKLSMMRSKEATDYMMEVLNK